MGENTKIEWCDHTFNPWIGCTKVATGCVNCYAERDFDKRRHFATWGPHGTRVLTSEANWKRPLKWNRDAERDGVRRRVFCASLADVFEDYSGNFPDNPPGVHGGVKCLVNSKGKRLCTRVGEEISEQWPDEDGWRPFTMYDARERLFLLIDSTPQLDWLLLTKRPQNILRMWPDDLPRENVWLGTSISTQTDAERNIPELMRCRDLSPVLFVSAEPLLGPVDLFEPTLIHYLNGNPIEILDWVIVGGESGPNARPCRPEWVRSVRDQCQEAKVPVFIKQLGANIVARNDQIDDVFNNGKSGWPNPSIEYDIHGFRENYQGADCRVHLRDKKGGDWMEWPEDLRVRQFPVDL